MGAQNCVVESCPNATHWTVHQRHTFCYINNHALVSAWPFGKAEADVYLDVGKHTQNSSPRLFSTQAVQINSL